jgi:YhcG PDDEXK nuclease domain
MGRQYKLMLGEKEYFFDLLFYHTRLKRYIVIDLKIDEFKPEYKGKMEFYLNLADEHLKQADDEKSIGLILCKTKDGLVAEYALRDSTKPIGIAEYKINELLPDEIRGDLPTIEELEIQIDKEYEELKALHKKNSMP